MTGNNGQHNLNGKTQPLGCAAAVGRKAVNAVLRSPGLSPTSGFTPHK